MANFSQVHALAKKLNGRGAFDGNSMKALFALAKEILAAEETKGDKTVFVVTVNSYDQKWYVHKAGCGHIGKELAKSGTASVVVAHSIAEVQAVIVDAEMVAMGWDASYFHTAPCAKK